ncbi:MAG: hypothetical protein ACQ5SW_00740 [Sphaerochaetaceae bacterium]
MAKNSKTNLTLLTTGKVQQLLIALLFIAMGMLGFVSASGAGTELSRELSNMFGGDRELLLYSISSLELICGIFLVIQYFMKGIPGKFGKLALTIILIFWIALIVILDVLTIDFGGFRGADWFSWIEQVVLHLIVLASIVQLQK